MDNLLMARSGLTREEAIGECKKARCHEFIMQLPQTFETEIVEEGDTLSGGQRQRLALSRTLLAEAKVILLDEIGSALDVENENAIMDMLQTLQEDKTIIMISQHINMAKTQTKSFSW
ncbi:hypothetical protein A8L45_06510 [Veronia pacifica]|uniref:ABC transporter domain-containing protein n=1 Tax=Veronia pacifica TaxID=1080227 RepID=A0A1C3EMB7_9GAMM|nr:hypothetical protein A8L45_06510 [Veronia pacifica]